MTTLYVKSNQDATEILSLVRTAVDGQIARLELALKLANKRLVAFEQKYGTPSEEFMTQMAVEDFSGEDGHEVYINWAGEFKLKQRLEAKLRKLRDIDYDDSNLLQPH